ncbi:MAG: PP2C family serine/threonine-protein phosphatase [Gammaproteobacteria bacterium]
MSFVSASFSATHVGHIRKYNEDSFLDKPEANLWVIADGMGGHDAGDVASQSIVASMNQCSFADPTISAEESTKKLKLSLYNTNSSLIKLGNENDRINGSTVVVMHIVNGECHFLWAGDSRLYLLRDQELTQLTRDHSQAEVYVDLGMLSRDEASRHSSANVLTRCIGTDDDLRLETGMIDLNVGDRFLLSSDGLDKHVPHSVIEETLNTYDREEAVQKLIRLALNDGGTDNITVSIVDIMAE